MNLLEFYSSEIIELAKAVPDPRRMAQKSAKTVQKLTFATLNSRMARYDSLYRELSKRLLQNEII